MKSVTIRDVAREAGVSIATVSRTLRGNGKVSEETSRRIIAAIRKTGYLPVSAENQPALAEEGLVYCIIKSASVNTYSLLLNKQLILAADKSGLKLVTANIESGNDRIDDEMLRNLRQAERIGVRGLIISGFSENSLSADVIRFLEKMLIPIVLINRAPTDFSFNRVLTGSERGSFLAARHMLENGRRHLLMVTFPRHRGKRFGFERAVTNWKGDPVHYQVVEAENDSYDSCERAFAEALKTDPGIDGILCSADEQAAWILQILLRQGKRVPEDVELIGFNDNLAPYLNPPVSSVRVPVREIAETAIGLILEQEKQKGFRQVKNIQLDPHLILR